MKIDLSYGIILELVRHNHEILGTRRGVLLDQNTLLAKPWRSTYTRGEDAAWRRRFVSVSATPARRRTVEASVPPILTFFSRVKLVGAGQRKDALNV